MIISAIFQSYSQTEDDISKMYEVGSDRCKYYTSYDTEKDSIHLSIEHDGILHCFVMLGYYDNKYYPQQPSDGR